MADPYEPISNGLVGEQYLIGVTPPIFNKWQFDTDTFRARQEVDREEIFGVNGDPAADSFSRAKVILSGDLKCKAISAVGQDPPNIGDYIQIAGGNERWKGPGGTRWWVLCTASEVTQTMNGKVLRCTVEFEYRPAIHDAINDAEISVTNADAI